MRLYVHKATEDQRSLEDLEEQTLYALAIHYIELMIYMKLPLDISSSTNLRHSTYNHMSHITSGDADSVTISKAVTANGDQWNEFFTITGVEDCGFVYEVQIFNKNTFHFLLFLAARIRDREKTQIHKVWY